jgi:hypothetical protein
VKYGEMLKSARMFTRMGEGIPIGLQAEQGLVSPATVLSSATSVGDLPGGVGFDTGGVGSDTGGVAAGDWGYADTWGFKM